MPGDTDIQPAQDEHEISRVVIGWGYARDQEDWERLSRCYHPGAEMNISWTRGTAEQFVERLSSRPPMYPGEHQKHQLGSPDIRLAGERAVSECHITLYSRIIIDELMWDFTAWSRFFDLFERRAGEWRITKRTAIYEKDRMDPVNPAEVPEGYFEGMDIDGYPAPCKFMCYRAAKHGRQPAPGIVSAGGEAERALRKEGGAWLHS